MYALLLLILIPFIATSWAKAQTQIFLGERLYKGCHRQHHSVGDASTYGSDRAGPADQPLASPGIISIALSWASVTAHDLVGYLYRGILPVGAARSSTKFTKVGLIPHTVYSSRVSFAITITALAIAMR